MELRLRERVEARAPDGFSTPEAELAYLRERVREKERELDVAAGGAESARLAAREVVLYAEAPAARVLHEAYAMPEYEILHTVLQLKPEKHDAQMDALLKVLSERGIRNALSIVARMKNPHVDDDFHRLLVRYVAEGLPQKGARPPERVRRALNLALYEVRPEGASSEEDGRKKLAEVLSSSEQLYASLLAMVGVGGSFSLEIAVPDGEEEAILFIAIPSEKRHMFERTVSSVFPNALISEARGDYNIFCDGGAEAGAYAHLAEAPALSLKTYDLFDHDPMNVVLAAFANIAKHGEGAALQIVVGNEGERYNAHYKKILRALERGERIEDALKTPETSFGEFVHDLGDTLFKSAKERAEKKAQEGKAAPDKTASEAVERKVRTRIAPATIRLAASAKERSRAEQLLENMIATLSQFDYATGNRFEYARVPPRKLGDFLRAFTYREEGGEYRESLSLAEVTTLFHLTAERVVSSRELKSSRAKQAPAPLGMNPDGLSLGVNRYGASESVVHFGTQDRLRHCYVVGQTGTGKTGLLKHMLIEDIKRGEGVGFIDPHGSDIDDILAAVPEERLGDVVYFDPANTARPMGLNMLEYDRSRPELKTFVVDEVYAIFRKLYADVPDAFGPMFEQYYRNSTLLVVDDPDSGNTLIEIPRVLADPAFRRLKLSRCKNPLVVQFWEGIAERAGGEASLENIVPYITAKVDVFLANDIMRPIVAQERSAFDFRELMDGKKIFLANLSKGRLGERNMSFLGLILVSKFLQAAFSRVDAGGALPPFYLYMDEFQNFATPSIATILAEARKYKLSLTVAHQFMAQLDETIRDAVIGNVGTKIAFRVGAADAEMLAKQFEPTFSASDLENLPNRQAVASLLVSGAPARPFTLETLDLPTVDHSRLPERKELSAAAYGRDRSEVEAEIAKKFGLTRRV